MTTIFPKESEQYEFAQVSLQKYLEEFSDSSEWELRTRIRADTMERCCQGLPVRKSVILRRPIALELMPRQIHSMLHILNARNPYNDLSKDIILFLDSLPPTEGFNCGDVALAMFGPSDKYYEKGKSEQNVKMKIRRLAYHNLLVLRKMKYYKLPAWFPFADEIRKMDETGKFKRGVIL